jgi:CheY-specific phosphatase CheX
MTDLPSSAISLVGELAENFAFLIPMGTCEAPSSTTWDVLLAVGFCQIGTHHRGRVLIGLTTSAAAEAARNILALDPDTAVDADSRRDAAGELANIIAGNLLPHLLGDGEGFDLSQPSPIPPQDLHGGIFIDLGDGVLGVAIEGGAA